MFVSDTIHNAQYIHNLFFPHDDGPNLIKHNTSTWPQLIWWFDHSFLYSYSSFCILYYCPKLRRSFTTKTFRQQWWLSSSSSCYFMWTPRINIQILLLTTERGRFSSGPRTRVTAVQPLLRGKPLCPPQQPAIHAVPTDLWTAVTSSREPPIADRSVTICVTILKGGSNLKSSCCLNRIPIKISLARFSIR